MYSQNHQQGHNARLNGAGRGMPNMMYNYQPHAQHQHPSQTQHHQGLQDHSIPNTNGIGHHSTFTMSTTNPFNTSAMTNGHAASSRGAQNAQNEHWQEQLRMHKEAERAHAAMTDQQQPHYYARLKASENRGISGPPPQATKAQADGEGDSIDRRRPLNLDREPRRQDWYNMDMSGQGLRNLAPELFRYQFLNELFLPSNKLTRLPKEIGELRQLRYLDCSYNQLSELPPELGMCTYLKHLLLFNNNIQELPFELGSLHLLEMLGIEGNPLDPNVKQEIVEKGTKSLVNALRENAPSKSFRGSEP
jgi:CCR4-NOT transcription complex subunit 6